MKIRFCERNKGKGKVYRRLTEEFPNLDIKIEECIKQCSTCCEIPVATIDKEKVTGRDGDDLYKKTIEIIAKSLNNT